MSRTRMPHFEVRQFTPDEALKILERNDKGQRPLTPSRINQYAEDMAAGRWHLNGEPVVFGANGKLFSGQHRMHACVKAGVPFTTVVVSNVSDEALYSIDTGKARTPADVLFMDGIKNSPIMAGAARTLALYRDRVANTNPDLTGPSIGGATTLTPSRILAIASKHAKLAHSVKAVSTKRVAGISAPALATVHYLAKHIAGQTRNADRWLEGILTGADLRADSPVLKARNDIINRKVTGYWPCFYRLTDSFNRMRDKEPAPARVRLPEPVAIRGAEPERIRV